MLDGIAPIVIFQIYKNIPDPGSSASAIPVVAGAYKRQTFAVIPLYLDENLTGLQIDNNSKQIDIETKPDTLTNGEAGNVNQSSLGSVTKITLKGKKGSVGLTILLALSEQMLDKLASQEYEITYMNGAVTVFGGLIHSFGFEPGTDDDLYRITIELSRGRAKNKTVSVGEDPTATRLGTQGVTPPANAPTVSVPAGGSSAGQSQIQPNVVQQGLR